MENTENLNLKSELIMFAKKVEDTQNPEEFWDEAVKLAKEEESFGGNNKYYKNISVPEIISFGESIKSLGTIDAKYKLMMQKSDSGELWYDILLGKANAAVFSLVEQTIQESADKHGKWKTALDIGAGTGNTLKAIAPYCEKVYGIDFSNFALLKAKENSLPSNAFLINGSAEELPFKDQSVDLIVSNGLIYYLSGKQTENFVHEISRVIKKNGKYYYSVNIKRKDEIVPRLSKEVLESAKAALIDIVGSMATEGGHPLSPALGEYNKLLLKNGFEITNTIQEEENDTFLVEYTHI